ncbi:HTTM domain-containing protein [Flavobacterium subsaxonicum]|uniref:HTTM domain-containing protein n=1 Tax=Flavobacterium subsaxonicum WB 4.1-42 = DSM 21790 TaxID=1121898 RepID=A0A0A2MW74_9FLAO|nr:HTTM domain-containing protein [Flavobacterium subsaxonicum]KGO92485.1 HTTM domain-containing protein [Flavobacterium subsaxonicum WB 4.1-42 = DSM 21790]
MMLALHKRIDNAPLIIFRIMLGILLAWHCIDHMVDGTVRKLYIRPKFTFNFIGMDWLQPLPGNGMYWYHGVMAFCALCVTIGFLYRYTLSLFAILFAGTYFMQKTVYNNHHYLLILLCIILLLLPANAFASVDSKINPKIKRYSMPQWCSYVLIAQMAIVYFFAAMAKLYPDWLNGTFPGFIVGNHGLHRLGGLLQHNYFHRFIAIGGFFFDLLVVPMLLIKKTRNLAALASVGFHTFNWYLLHIGIFPFLSLSYLVFFYPSDRVRALFFWKKPPLNQVIEEPEDQHNNLLILKYFFIPYFIIQLALPVRHHFIKGDVVWTEEGHRLSWRMMLRLKSGETIFKIKDKKTGERFDFDYTLLFTKRQNKRFSGKGDVIWQGAQRIKAYYAKQGRDVAVYVDNKVSLNRRPPRLYADPNVDLASVQWNYFGHNEWILLYDDYPE